MSEKKVGAANVKMEIKRIIKPLINSLLQIVSH